MRCGGASTEDGGLTHHGTWKLVCPGGPKPEREWKIGCERAVQLSLRVADGRGGQYTEGEGDGSRKQSNSGTGL